MPCTGCVSHTIYLAHGNSKGKADKNRMKYGRNMGTLKEKSPKQCPTIEFSEERESPTIY